MVSSIFTILILLSSRSYVLEIRNASEFLIARFPYNAIRARWVDCVCIQKDIHLNRVYVSLINTSPKSYKHAFYDEPFKSFSIRTPMHRRYIVLQNISVSFTSLVMISQFDNHFEIRIYYLNIIVFVNNSQTQ